ncbi:MAG: hypothetical protein CMP28_13995 [Roseibacillus sp.]|nr:hypothetical protein [Roseibacillus sp.]
MKVVDFPETGGRRLRQRSRLVKPGGRGANTISPPFNSLFATTVSLPAACGSTNLPNFTPPYPP